MYIYIHFTFIFKNIYTVSLYTRNFNLVLDFLVRGVSENEIGLDILSIKISSLGYHGLLGANETGVATNVKKRFIKQLKSKKQNAWWSQEEGSGVGFGLWK